MPLRPAGAIPRASCCSRSFPSSRPLRSTLWLSGKGVELLLAESPQADRVHLDPAFVEEDEINLFPIGLERPQREPIAPECFHFFLHGFPLMNSGLGREGPRSSEQDTETRYAEHCEDERHSQIDHVIRSHQGDRPFLIQSACPMCSKRSSNTFLSAGPVRFQNKGFWQTQHLPISTRLRTRFPSAFSNPAPTRRSCLKLIP